MAKNIKEIMIDATKYPAAVENRLPAGAPKISTMLVDFAAKLPAIPDLPIDVPALPEVPVLPEIPGAPELRRFVTGVEVTPVTERAPTPTPRAVASRPQSEKIPLVYE